jgi:2-dehydro-3-deoxyphosphogluconate aldolase/(4S)-4-hydroxy-2-oxoglutarate aldolase
MAGEIALMKHFETALHRQFVLPILRLDDPQTCLHLARCLVKAGFEILEITLTTPEALKLIANLAQEGICIGAGTVLSKIEAERALASGAQFLVSPGLSLEIAQVANKAQLPYFPGVYTPSEVMTALNHGLTRLKLFPASTGGLDYLKHLQGPFPQVQWLPTGGLHFADLKAWQRAGVLAVGQGTRLISPAALARQDWASIEQELRSLQAEIQSWFVA